MVRPLIFNSHLDESRVESAVRTLVNDCPFLAGRLHRDPVTREVVIVCNQDAQEHTRYDSCSSVAIQLQMSNSSWPNLPQLHTTNVCPAHSPDPQRNDCTRLDG
jgi:hypothetical protein